MNDNTTPVILIADSQEGNIDELRQILGPVYAVVTADTGEDACQIAEKISPDLILLNLSLPDTSGFEVISRLKGSEQTKDISVICITERHTTEDEERGLSLGAVDYISKPFHHAVVKLRVRAQMKVIEQMRMIERLGTIDALTNIPNRRSFDHRLHAEWHRAMRDQTKLGILMLDIDHFKNYNDTHGHAQGDEVLRAVATELDKTLKRSSDFVARWGGEEFTVLLPGTDLTGTVEIAERIRKSIKARSIPGADGRDTKITVSIGAHSEIPTPEGTMTSFITSADKALYLAKHAGRNNVKAYIPSPEDVAPHDI